MIERQLESKISEYKPANAIEQENVLQELVQMFVLTSLSKARFFYQAQFHGGTFLRIIHGLDRFSEDLDFVLKNPEPNFCWHPYLEKVQFDLEEQGLKIEIVDKSSLDNTVKKAFLKTDSIGKLLVVDLPYSRHPSNKIKIKLEIDSNPPAGSDFETHYLNFPILAPLTTQTLSSAFASKSHALLCRNYIKGRDWYDFLWYSSKKIIPNFELLKNALYQQGPWANQQIEFNPGWYLYNLGQVIADIDWKQTAEDVSRFLPASRQASLELWNRELFDYHLNLLKTHLDLEKL